MRRDELAELHYITHTDNLASIVSTGILSHRRAAAVQHISVAMEEIQERRAKVVIPRGRRVVRISTDVLDLPGVVIADKNASSDYVAFRPSPDGLRVIDSERVFAVSWDHADMIEKLRHGSEMCAEVLVPDVVAPQFIRGIYVPSTALLNEVTTKHYPVPGVLNRNIFLL